MKIELRLLGGFECAVDGTPVRELTGGAPVRLLAFLAMHRRTHHQRSRLATALWPDEDEARARRKLSTALWSLRRTIATDTNLICADQHTVWLDPTASLWIDVDAFETAVAAFGRRDDEGTTIERLGGLQEALALYRGELLSGFADEWIEGARHHARERYLAAQRLAIDLERRSGRFDEAIARARTLVAETPCAEEAHVELIRLYWLSGRVGEALDQFDRCKRILDEELDALPSAELMELRRQIRVAGSGSGPRAAEVEDVDDRNSLVGRSAERAALLALVDGAGTDGGGFAMVEGPVGIGKTRLLNDIADAARWRGAAVIWADHDTQGAIEPYAGIGRALETAIEGLRREQVRARLGEDTLRIVSRLLRRLHAADETRQPIDAWASPEERWRLQEGLVQVLLALAACTPTLVVLDDVHAADLDTVELLRLTASRTVSGRFTVIAGYRRREAQARPEVWNLLVDIERNQRVRRISLRPLSIGPIAEMIAAQPQLPAMGDLAERVHRATGGNPLFVTETLRTIARSCAHIGPGRAIDEDVLARIDLDSPASLERVIGVLVEELHQLPPLSARVVDALAVWGAPAASTTIAALLGVSGLELLSAIGAAIDVGFVEESGDGYGLRFGHLAVAARDQLDPSDRVDLHRRAAAELAASERASLAELARHHRAGGQWPQAADLEYRAASYAASLHSYEVAAHYHARSSEALERAELVASARQLLDHERVLDVLGRQLERSDVLDRIDALKEISPDDVVLAKSRRSQFFVDIDDPTEAIRYATEAVGFAVAAGVEWRPAVVNLARVLIRAGHPHLGYAHLEGADLGPLQVGRGQAELALGIALADLVEFEAAERHLGGALEQFRTLGDSRGEVEALSAIAVLQAQTGATAASLATFTEALDTARRIGHRYGEGMVLTNLAAVHQLVGNIGEAIASSDEAIDVFTAIGNRRGEAIVRINAASLAHNVLGDDTRAEREASIARRSFEQLADERRQAMCLDILAGVRRRRRAFAQARRLLHDARDLLHGSGDTWLEVEVLRSLAWTEFDAGRLDEAADVAAEATRLAVESSMDIRVPVLLALRGRILATAGRLDEALALTAQSMEADRDDADLAHLAALWRHDVFTLGGRADLAHHQIGLAHRRLATLLEPLDEDQREVVLTDVPEYRHIAERFDASHIQERVRTLPALSDDAGTVEVLWTIHHPDDLTVADKSGRRLRRLHRLIAEATDQGGRPRLRDLAEALDTSLATVKRDLATIRSGDSTTI